MAGELEPWGGEVHMPRWLRRLLRRPPEPGDTPEKAAEPRRAQQASVSVLQNANRAGAGHMVELYNEGRDVRRRGATGRRGD
jgi:hypothetical protein